MKAYVVKARAKLGNLPNLINYKNLIGEQDLYRKFDKVKQLHPSLQKIKDIDQVEHELDFEISRNIKSLSYFLNGYEEEFFEKYVSAFEIRLIQNVIQGILNKSLNNSLYLFTNNPFSKNLVIKKDMKFEDFVASLKNTRYHRTLVPFLNENMSKDSMIFLISNSLTKFYFRDLLDYSSKFPKDLAKKIRIFIGKEIDLYNIEMLYRLISYFDLPAYEIFNYLIEGGYKLKAYKLKKLSNMTIDKFKKEMKETPYGHIFSGIFDINKALMEEKHKIYKDLSKEDNVLYLIYAVNLLVISNNNIISILNMDDSFTKEEQESLIVTG
ncbi:MAG: V-type ATPase subunit [Peptoniphilaceae bacterium]|nr:V-type ATPase subunit [Peptoniphilaceae bacterium]MDY6018928.1 V-type ATPase subunit [Anaerococcus sp.]